MIGLRALKDKFISPPAPVAAALLTFKKDWKRTMETIDSKIDAARERLARFESERKAAIIASVEGDETAAKNADKLDRHIADVHRELERLLVARDNASQHVATEDAAAAAKRERKRLEGIRKTAEAWHEATKAAEAAVVFAAEKLAEARAIADDLRVRIDNSEFEDTLRNVIISTPVVVNDQLGVSKFPFKSAPFLSDEKRSLMGWLPDLDYIVALATPARKAAE